MQYMRLADWWSTTGSMYEESRPPGYPYVSNQAVFLFSNLSLSLIHIFTRQKLLERLWDDQGNFVDEHTLTTVISRMRGKLEGSHPYIKTVYGMGYLWNAKSGRRDG